MTAKKTPPILDLPTSTWFNLRKIDSYSPTGRLVPTASRKPLGEFLKGYGLEQPASAADQPLPRLRSYLAKQEGSVSRFSDGSFPIVYMGDEPETGLAEVVYHLTKTLAESACIKDASYRFQVAKFDMEGQTLDVRKGFPALHRPDDYSPSQAFGAKAKADKRQGISFKSVRRKKHTNVAVLRSDLVTAGANVDVILLTWDGSKLVRL